MLTSAKVVVNESEDEAIHRVIFVVHTGATGRTVRVELLSEDGKLIGDGPEPVSVPKGAIPYVRFSQSER